MQKSPTTPPASELKKRAERALVRGMLASTSAVIITSLPVFGRPSIGAAAAIIVLITLAGYEAVTVVNVVVAMTTRVNVCEADVLEAGDDDTFYCEHGTVVAREGGACYRCAQEDARDDDYGGDD